MKVGILGTGFGAFHASIYRKLGIDVLMWGRNREKLNALQAELGVETTMNEQDIFDNGAIGLVDICLPNQLHTATALRALETGKHAFCETPLCTDNKQCDALLLAEKQSGKRLFVNQFTKFIPEYRYTKDAAASNRLGKLLSLRAWRNTAPIWGTLGMETISTSLMIHELDFVTWLLGGPCSVNAYAVSKGKEEAHVEAILQYKACTALVSASSMMPMGYPFSTGFIAEFEQGAIEASSVFENDEMPTKSIIEYSNGRKQILSLQQADPYEQAIKHVLNCCASGLPADCSAIDAVLAAKAAITIRERIL